MKFWWVTCRKSEQRSKNKLSATESVENRKASSNARPLGALLHTTTTTIFTFSDFPKMRIGRELGSRIATLQNCYLKRQNNCITHTNYAIGTLKTPNLLTWSKNLNYKGTPFQQFFRKIQQFINQILLLRQESHQNLDPWQLHTERRENVWKCRMIKRENSHVKWVMLKIIWKFENWSEL